MPTLLAGSASVITTSSAAARLWGRIDIDDLNNDRRFSARKAYGDSKLANILFTKELHRRFHPDGLSAAAFHPGPVATGFASGSTSPMRWVYQSPLHHVAGLISPDQGAITLIWLAEMTPGTDWESGEFYEGCRSWRDQPASGGCRSARDFWDRSAELVGL